MFDFERISRELHDLEAERGTEFLEMDQQEMYILHCLYHQLPPTDIDFSKFSSLAIDSAEERFEDSVQYEDEDGNVRFSRESSWATIDGMAGIMNNLESVKGRRVKPAFPLL